MTPAGKYVGNRPVKLKKADNTAIRPVEIGYKKAKQLEKDLKKNRHRPYWGAWTVHVGAILSSGWFPLDLSMKDQSRHPINLPTLRHYYSHQSVALVLLLDAAVHHQWHDTEYNA